MPTFTLSPSAVLYHADCRDAIKSMPDNSIDSVVTDPPYALVSIVKRFGSANAAPAKGNDAYMRASAGFMGKTWDTGEVAFSEEFWREVLRVLKPGGHVAAFGASRGYHRMACAIEDAGFEIRDSLMWLYGTGFPKSHDVSKGIGKAAGAEREVTGIAGRSKVGGGDVCTTGMTGGDYFHTAPATPESATWQGWGTALKPAFEPIVLARKPLSEGTVAANVLRWGTGALNIDATRIHVDGESTAREYSGKRLKPDATLAATGGSWKSETETYEGVTKEGRWPANVLHDGSDEVVAGFPSNSARFFFNSAESDEQWLARNLPNALAFGAEQRFNLGDAPAAIALSNAVIASTLPWVLTVPDWRDRSMNVTPNELRQISERLIEMIQSIGAKCSPESLPVKHSLSDSLASIVATREQIDTITITISPSKSNGNAAPAIFNIMRQNSDRGAKDCERSSVRFHYSAKASKADRNGSKHPTVKPIACMEWLCTLITPPGGKILDPFAGSGTTGIAAANKGFSVVLCEREDEYVADIQRRFGTPRPSFNLTPLFPKPNEIAAWAAFEKSLRSRSIIVDSKHNVS